MTEKQKEYNRKWKAKNRERIKQRDREYRILNAKERNARNKIYREQHPDMVRESYKKYRNKNIDEWNRKNHIRGKARRDIALKKMCEICGAKAQVRHHPDYNDALLILHLCRKCHSDIHRSEHEEIAYER
jgi:hypothetical protein